MKNTRENIVLSAIVYNSVSLLLPVHLFLWAQPTQGPIMSNFDDAAEVYFVQICGHFFLCAYFFLLRTFFSYICVQLGREGQLATNGLHFRSSAHESSLVLHLCEEL